MAHVRQSRPDSGLDFQAKVLKTLEIVLTWNSLLSSGVVEGARDDGDRAVGDAQRLVEVLRRCDHFLVANFLFNGDIISWCRGTSLIRTPPPRTTIGP